MGFTVIAIVLTIAAAAAVKSGKITAWKASESSEDEQSPLKTNGENREKAEGDVSVNASYDEDSAPAVTLVTNGEAPLVQSTVGQESPTPPDTYGKSLEE